MPEKNNNQQVNVDFSNFPELLQGLDEMVAEDMTDRSKFLRKLIQQELNRRRQLPLPFPLDEPKKKTNPRLKSVAPVAAY